MRATGSRPKKYQCNAEPDFAAAVRTARLFERSSASAVILRDGLGALVKTPGMQNSGP